MSIVHERKIFTDRAEAENHYASRGYPMCYQDGGRLFRHVATKIEFPEMLYHRRENDYPFCSKIETGQDRLVVSMQSVGTTELKLQGENNSEKVAIYLNDDISQIRANSTSAVDCVSFSTSFVMGELGAARGTPCHKALRMSYSSSLPSSSQAMVINIILAIKAACEVDETPISNEIAATYLSQALVNILMFGVPHNFHNELCNARCDIAPFKIKRAIEFMQANAHRAVRLHEVANYAAISTRGLQVAFLSARGISPMSYLRGIRLERARSDIRDVSDRATCVEISRRWGFNNFHRFIQIYSKSFGTDPRMESMKIRGFF